MDNVSNLKKPVVVGMRPNPEPHYCVVFLESKRSPPESDTNRISWVLLADSLEFQTGMLRI